MKTIYWIKNIVKIIAVTLCGSLFITTFASGIIYEQEPISYTANISALGKSEVDSDRLDQEEVMNILLIGTDDGKSELDVDARADSITIASINLRENTIKLISVERSITVPIDSTGEDDWITHQFRYEGVDGVMESLQDEFGLDIEKYVRVNFTAFAEIIDIMGGVDIKLNSSEVIALNQIGMNETVFLGENELDGYESLSYARLRSIDSNYERMDRQKNVIKAIVSEAKNLSTVELIRIAAKILPKVDTNFKISEITDLINRYKKILSGNIQQMTIPDKEDIIGGDVTADGRILTRVNFPRIQIKLHNFLYNEELEIDAEKEAELDNYVSTYTPQEVFDTDPHQDVDDSILASEEYVVVEVPKNTGTAESQQTPSTPQQLHDNKGIDQSGVNLPTLPKKETIVQEPEPEQSQLDGDVYNIKSKEKTTVKSSSQDEQKETQSSKDNSASVESEDREERATAIAEAYTSEN